MADNWKQPMEDTGIPALLKKQGYKEIDMQQGCGESTFFFFVHPETLQTIRVTIGVDDDEEMAAYLGVDDSELTDDPDENEKLFRDAIAEVE